MAGKPPKTGPGTIAADLALREGAALARRAMEKRLARSGYSKKQIRKIIEGKGFGRNVAATAIARLATRSIPGALVVGSGLVAKALFDLRRSRRGEPDAGETLEAVEEGAE
jgi:hypothetical protein